jgi:hypothetical protein
MERQANYKNSPFFYQLAPFLTIAEDLLKLIKEGKVKNVIFLSAYDKRKFPNGDPRKIEMFKQTFYNLNKSWGEGLLTDCEIRLELIPFDNETQGQNKAD